MIKREILSVPDLSCRRNEFCPTRPEVLRAHKRFSEARNQCHGSRHVPRLYPVTITENRLAANVGILKFRFEGQ